MHNRSFAGAMALAFLSLMTDAGAGQSDCGWPDQAVCQAPAASPRSAAFDAIEWPMTQVQAPAVANHPYVGMWVTPDGRIRHELLPNGRYDEARGTRESAYRGRYEVNGNRIEYWDDTGFTADGVFVSTDVLHHGGMIFHRRK
jgi:hypothetical protein